MQQTDFDIEIWPFLGENQCDIFHNCQNVFELHSDTRCWLVRVVDSMAEELLDFISEIGNTASVFVSSGRGT